METNVDDLLREMDDLLQDVPPPKSFPKPSSQPTQPAPVMSSSKKTKCWPIYVGNRQYAKMGREVCMQMRCVKCDLKVQCFPERAWLDQEVNYLFFRNNFNNESALRAHQRSAPTQTSYNCQCSWASVDLFQRLDDVPGVSWACAGHF